MIGALSLLAGSTSLGLWLTRTRGTAVRILAAVASIVVFWVTFGFIDEGMQSLLGTTDPAWIHDEAGIVVTAVIWLAIGLRVRARARGVAAPGAAT